MDDLDALLADLQTNLNKSEGHPAAPLHHHTTTHHATTLITNNQPTTTQTELVRTIVTDQQHQNNQFNHHHNNRTTRDQLPQSQPYSQPQSQPYSPPQSQPYSQPQSQLQSQPYSPPQSQPQSQHIYQNDDYTTKVNSTQVENYHNGFYHTDPTTSRPSSKEVLPSTTQHNHTTQPHNHTPTTSTTTVYQNVPSKEQMYRHEMREEVRTETRSSGPSIATPLASQQQPSMSNNLSELDSLLYDLNTSKQNTALHKESSVVVQNGASRPSVDSLLDELNSVGHRETVEQRAYKQHYETSHAPPPPPAPTPLLPCQPRVTHVSHVSASNATKELDDLMESLSDFKGGENQKHVTSGRKELAAKTITETITKTLEKTVAEATAEMIAKSTAESIAKTTAKSTAESAETTTAKNTAKSTADTTAKTTAKSSTAETSNKSVHQNVQREEAVKKSTVQSRVVETQNQRKGTHETTSSSKVTDGDAPPRPPSPEEKDVFSVPPPRPPAPFDTLLLSDDTLVPSFLPVPIFPSPTPSTVSVIYTQADQPPYRVCGDIGATNANDNSTNIRYSCTYYGDASINASTLQSINNQSDTAYAKPIPKRRSPSPPPPPKPQPPPMPQTQPAQPTQPVAKPTPPPNQLDSMLGSLTSHMTEQGINTAQKGCCCACDKPIVGQVITALGKTWHPEHFTCTHCKEELGTKNFFERDGKPYCEPDYHNLFSPKCSYCSGPILDKCVTAMNTTWHPEHFFCAQCGNTFGEEGFHEKNGKPYCKEDYFNMFAPKCGGCNSPIMENYISALNGQWHPECFVCRDCKQSVSNKSFYEMEGKPVCGECLGVEDDGEEEEDDD